MKRKTLEQMMGSDIILRSFVLEALMKYTSAVMADKEDILSDSRWKRSLITPEAWIDAAYRVDAFLNDYTRLE